MKLFSEFNTESQKYEMAGIWNEDGVEKTKIVEINWIHGHSVSWLVNKMTEAANEILRNEKCGTV